MNFLLKKIKIQRIEFYLTYTNSYFNTKFRFVSKHFHFIYKSLFKIEKKCMFKEEEEETNWIKVYLFKNNLLFIVHFHIFVIFLLIFHFLVVIHQIFHAQPRVHFLMFQFQLNQVH